MVAVIFNETSTHDLASSFGSTDTEGTARQHDLETRHRPSGSPQWRILDVKMQDRSTSPPYAPKARTPALARGKKPLISRHV